jgi:DNA repair protein RecO (recombination protein O)
LVLRTHDWSESSRIATLWTREFGKLRVLAKGGRRLKSNFDLALDLLNVCGIVFLRKSPGSLDLLTESQVVRRYPRLRADLAALHAAYYVAELLADCTEDYDPHPDLFEESLAALEDFGAPPAATPVRLMRYELVLLRELGFAPVLGACAGCGGAPGGAALAFSPGAGGVVCPACAAPHRDRRPLSRPAWEALQAWAASAEAWRQDWAPAVRRELRQLLGHYVTYVTGRRPRLLSYLGS